MKNIPKIRIKGFEGEWCYSKLEKLSAFSKGQGYSKGNLNPTGNTPIILYGRMYTNYEPIITHVDTFANKKENSILSEGDEVIVPASGETAEDISIASAVVQKEVILGGDLNIIKPHKELSPSFLALSISNSKIHKELSTKAQGKSIVHLHNEDLKKVSISYPNTNEQEAISTFFQNLDNLITEQKNKLENLQKVKKSMLCKMFPKEGQKVPEIRFKGFEKDWEEKKLGEISSKVVEKNSKLEFSETFTNSAEMGIISQQDYFDHDISNINNIGNYYVTRPNNFVYNPRISTSAPVGPIKRNKLGRIGVMSPLYYVFKAEGIDYTFLEKYFETNLWHNFMKINGDSGARSDRFSIKDSIFTKMPILTPSPEEQALISFFIESIYQGIYLQQKKIEQLQHLKLSLLSKMFV